MYLLYLTDAFPYPLTSGQLRHHHLLRHLAERHDVHLLSLVGSDHRPEWQAELARLGVSSEVFDRSRLAHRVTSVLPGVPLAGVVALRRVARQRLEAGLVDATVLSGRHTAAALGALRGRPLVVDGEATSSRLRAEARLRGGGRRLALHLEAESLRLVEHRLRRLADHLVVASAGDGERLGFLAERCTVVPNGVDVGYWRRRTRRLGRDTVVFTGKLDAPPNDDAARQLVVALPALRAEVPEAELLLVGLRPSAELVATAARTGAVVTGEVPDVRPYLERATVFAAPLRFGADLPNTVLEALAMDVPVVCSSLVAAGLRAGGQAPPVEVADGAGPLVVTLAARLRAARRDPFPGNAGSDHVRRHFSWERSAAVLEGHLQRLVVAATPARPKPELRASWTVDRWLAG